MLYKMLTLLAMLTTFAGMAPTSHAPVRSQPARAGEKVAEVKVFAPENGHRAGIGSQGWFIDLEAEFDLHLERTGFSGLQLTGPGVHTNVAPMPGSFSKGADDRFPGLIVLLSTTQTQRGRHADRLFRSWAKSRELVQFDRSDRSHEAVNRVVGNLDRGCAAVWSQHRPHRVCGHCR